jgi:hypothetical protein
VEATQKGVQNTYEDSNREVEEAFLAIGKVDAMALGNIFHLHGFETRNRKKKRTGDARAWPSLQVSIRSWALSRAHIQLYLTARGWVCSRKKKRVVGTWDPSGTRAPVHRFKRRERRCHTTHTTSWPVGRKPRYSLLLLFFFCFFFSISVLVFQNLKKIQIQTNPKFVKIK